MTVRGIADQTACRYWIGAEGRRCGVTPARPYLPGPRCTDHTPARLAGRPEPGQGAYCPPGICLCGRCPHWKPTPFSLDDLNVAHAAARRTGCHDPGHQLAVAVATTLTAREGAA